MNEFSLAVLILAFCVFAASAAAKLRGRKEYRSFRAGLRETALIPDHLLPAAVVLLPGIEAVTAAGLAAAAVAVATVRPGAKLATEVALSAAAMLTGVLAVGVAVVIRRGTRARCACFGAGAGRPLGRVHLIRNAALLAVLAAGVAGGALGQGSPAPAGALVAAGAGVVAALLFIRWEELAELFAPMPPAPATTPAIQRRGHRHR